MNRPMQYLTKIALLVTLSTGLANAQTAKPVAPAPVPARSPVKYCIEDICLGDAIRKFNASQVDPNQSMFLGSVADHWKRLAERHPVCVYDAQSIRLITTSGRSASVSFFPYAGPLGSHYRVGAVTVSVAGRFTKEQARKVFEDKKVGPMIEIKPFLTTYAAGVGYKSKEFGQIDYFLDVKLNEADMDVQYRHDQLKNQEYLIKQDGCASKTPKL